MKSVLIKLILFVGLFFAADFILGLVIGHFYGESKNINLKDANHGFLENIEDDILIFGSSELSHALITNRIIEKTGLSSYNLACDACGIYYQVPLLKTILDKHVPKVIILSSNQMNEGELGYLSKLYPFYKKNAYVREVVDELLPKEFLKLAFHGYVYNSKLIRIFDSKDDNQNGYVPLPVAESKMKYLITDELPQGEKHQISRDTDNHFRNLVKNATDKGVKVYVFVPPTVAKIDEAYWKQMRLTVIASGATLIDFSKDLELINQSELFYDRTHLNEDGAKTVTDRVLKVLKADGVY